MFRAIIGILIALIVTAFIRGVMGLISKEVGSMMKEESDSASAASGSKPGAKAAPPPPNAANELIKCAVCGTYVPGNRLIQGKYCSAECAGKAS